MANICSNFVEIEKSFSSREELENDLLYSFYNKTKNLKEDEELCFFEFFIPTPENIENKDLAKWHVENWGTKSEVVLDRYSFSKLNVSDNKIEICVGFDTDWDPPIKIYEYLNGKGYNIYAEFLEEASLFVGKYSSKDGYECDEIPDPEYERSDDEPELETVYKQLDEKYEIFDGYYYIDRLSDMDL